MDLDALGNLGDFFGGTAVFVSLIYLAFQIRYQSKIATAQMQQMRADANLQMGMPMWSSEENFAMLHRIFNEELGPDELDSADLFRAQMLLGPFRGSLENTFIQHQSGFLSDEVYESVSVPNCATLGPAFLRFGLALSESFRAELTRIISENKPGIGDFEH